MSGGSFDYKCFAISQFAEELQLKIDNNQIEDDYGYAPNFTDETIQTLIDCHKIIERAGKLAKDIEWLYSGDLGEDTFAKRINR